jgi:hypothetical protein
MNRNAPITRAIVASAFLCALSAVSPLVAQEGVIMRNILGKIGLLPEEKDPIEYRERPSLVVPKNLDALRPPEPAEGHTKTAQWPKDPDVIAREKELARRRQPSLFGRNDQDDAKRLSVEELARGRTAQGETVTEGQVPRNDQVGVRLNPQEMEAARRTSSAPSYPPGTEPPRKYLTDPPTGLRLPASTAPTKRTVDGPEVDRFREDPWKRID